MGQELALDGNTIGLWIPTDGLPSNDGAPAGGSATPLSLSSTGDQHIPAFTDYSPVAGAYARLFTSFYGETRANGYTLARSVDATDTTLMQGSWTIEFLIRVDLFPPAAQVAGLVGVCGNATSTASVNNHQGRIGVTETGMLTVNWEHGSSGAGTTVTQSTGSPVSLGVWHHIAVTKDVALKEVKFYLDGVLQDTRSYVTEPDGGGGSDWRLSRRSTSVPGSPNDLCGAFAIRALNASNVVRDVTWISTSAALKNTTGLLSSDGSTIRNWLFDDAPSVKDYAPIRMHLFTEGASASNVSNPTGNQGLVGAGPSRSHNLTALRGVYHPTYSAAFKTNWTWEGWYLLAYNPGVDLGFFSWGRSTSDSNARTNRIYLRYEASSTKLHLNYEHSTGTDVNVYSENGGVLPFGSPLHIAVTAALSAGTWTIKLYVNGVDVTQLAGASGLTPYSGGDDAHDTAIHIGHGELAATGSTRLGQFSGVVGSCRLSNVARTPTEIMASYVAGSSVLIIPLEEL